MAQAYKEKNSTCRMLGHAWEVTTSDGWFFCPRSHCNTYATCPACLGYRLLDTVLVFCPRHLSEQQFIESYPIAEAVPAEPVVEVEQHTLW